MKAADLAESINRASALFIYMAGRIRAALRINGVPGRAGQIKPDKESHKAAAEHAAGGREQREEIAWVLCTNSGLFRGMGHSAAGTTLVREDHGQVRSKGNPVLIVKPPCHLTQDRTGPGLGKLGLWGGIEGHRHSHRDAEPRTGIAQLGGAAGQSHGAGEQLHQCMGSPCPMQSSSPCQ